MAVLLQPIRVGDRRRSAPAWLILCEGSLRGILSQGDDDEVILAIACDRRIQTAHPMRFTGLPQARAWVSRRLSLRAARWSSETGLRGARAADLPASPHDRDV